MLVKWNKKNILITAITLLICSCSSTDKTEKTIATIFSKDKSRVMIIKSIIPGSILDSYLEIDIYRTSDKSINDEIQLAYLHDCERVLIEFIENNSSRVFLNKGGVGPVFPSLNEKFEWIISNNIDSESTIKSKMRLNNGQFYISDCEKYTDPDEYYRKRE